MFANSNTKACSFVLIQNICMGWGRQTNTTFPTASHHSSTSLNISWRFTATVPAVSTPGWPRGLMRGWRGRPGPAQAGSPSTQRPACGFGRRAAPQRTGRRRRQAQQARRQSAAWRQRKCADTRETKPYACRRGDRTLMRDETKGTLHCRARLLTGNQLISAHLIAKCG